MSPSEDSAAPSAAPVLVLVGLALAAGAWLLPANLKSISPALLQAAGEDTPSLSAFGGQLVEAERIGPAELVLQAARTVGDPGAPRLARELSALTSRQPALVAWGGWDPFLDPLFDLRRPSGHAESTPVLTFFIPERARAALREMLSGSGSLGVQSILRLRDVPGTGRFAPADGPGGQPLDALILLTALLYQSDHLSPPLQRELRNLADNAASTGELGRLEPFFLDLLSLGRRLDWVQLGELTRRTESARSVAEFAHLARIAPGQLPLIYAATLCVDSADSVSEYLIQYGRPGSEDLRLALADGQGAVRELLGRQLPVNRSAGPTLAAASGLVLDHPQLMLALKYLGYLVGLFLVLRGLDRWVVSPGAAGRSAGARPHLTAGVLAVLLAGILVLATEPYLLKAAPPSEYRFQVHLPVLVTAGPAPAPPSNPSSLTSMDPATIISIAFFLLLQVAMYLVCLRKIAEIDEQDTPAALKLRLMENEENLFDSGLYVGMMGTAAALVLQVLGVIPPNLLAAYSSNLFGIVCVAFVKIRHVRGYKRQLILEIQGGAQA